MRRTNINENDLKIYEPILLAKPNTRQPFSNFPDTSGILEKVGKIYSGILPNEINIANTAIKWNCRRWAMIMLPLPYNKQDRINLLARELFHISQQALGFNLFNTEYNHLDQKLRNIVYKQKFRYFKSRVSVFYLHALPKS